MLRIAISVIVGEVGNTTVGIECVAPRLGAVVGSLCIVQPELRRCKRKAKSSIPEPLLIISQQPVASARAVSATDDVCWVV